MFLALFGLFVAQVTGSFVLTGAQFVTQDPGVGVKVVGIPAFFLASVATTVMVRSAERRGKDALPAALALEAVLLTGLLVSWLAGRPLGEPNALADLLVGLSGIFAMGVQSALVRLLVQGAPSTSVMTTNTTQLAIDTTEFVLAWWRRGGVPADTKAAGEYVEIKRRLSKLWPVVLGFLLGTSRAPSPMFGLTCGAWCSPLQSLGRYRSGRSRFRAKTCPGLDASKNPVLPLAFTLTQGAVQ